MIDVFTFFVAGSIFGLAGGFSPGPTTTIVVSQTLRFGVLDGIKAAIAPALTDECRATKLIEDRVASGDTEQVGQVI